MSTYIIINLSETRITRKHQFLESHSVPFIKQWGFALAILKYVFLNRFFCNLYRSEGYEIQYIMKGFASAQL